MLVIAAAGIWGTSQSCSAFGSWVFGCLWVCTYWISIKILGCWVTFAAWNLLWFFLHQGKVDAGNKKSCSVCPASLTILIPPRTLSPSWLAVFTWVSCLSEPHLMCCILWACCYPICNNIKVIYHLNRSQGCVWFEGGREKARSTARAEAHGARHLSLSSLNSFGAHGLQTLGTWGGCSRARECTSRALIPNATNAMECCPGKTQPEHHTRIGTGREDFSQGVLGVWGCSALNI